MQRKTRALMQEAQSGGNPQEIGPKVAKIRNDHQRQIEALLSDGQKVQWQGLLGKPFDFSD